MGYDAHVKGARSGRLVIRSTRRTTAARSACGCRPRIPWFAATPPLPLLDCL